MKSLLATALLTALVLGPSLPAAGEVKPTPKPKPSPSATPTTKAGTNKKGLWTLGTMKTTGDRAAAKKSGSQADPASAESTTPCPEDRVTGDYVMFFYCRTQDFSAPAVITAGLIRSAFAELKLPAGELVIQPPDGLTLVNFDTNFYTTTTEPISTTVTLLGQRVTLEATPDTYTWDFGDGTRTSTTVPGAPYPRLDVTHNYLRTGTYRPSLSTTYTGRYRVDGRAWRPIPGTVTIDGNGQPLRAIEAQPKLVGY